MGRQLIILLIGAIVLLVDDVSSIPEDRFFYYAYGSNLLAQRMHIQNPSAEFYDIAKVDGYRLDFNIQSPVWNGAVATICEDPESTVWGTVWTILKSQIANIDNQETSEGWYKAMNISVVTPKDEQLQARVYIEVNNPEKLKVNETLPLERQPSHTYLKVIRHGARESGLPSYYCSWLDTIPDNGKLATLTRRQDLGDPFLE